MPLQNRVDPFGRIAAVSARGMFTGNRGIIHDPDTHRLLKRRWTTKAWIVCACSYKDRPARNVMGRQGNGRVGWTELFFLDEPTALAAGHRPCFLCHRERAKDFLARFMVAAELVANVPEIDRRLHAERLASGGRPPVIAGGDLRKLPDGTFVAIGEKAFAVKRGRLLPWSFDGYGVPVAIGERPTLPVVLLTPRTTVDVLRAGYRPEWHGSAQHRA